MATNQDVINRFLQPLRFPHELTAQHNPHMLPRGLKTKSLHAMPPGQGSMSRNRAYAAGMGYTRAATQGQAPTVPRSPHFLTLAQLYSYDTRVARLMFNMYSRQFELWTSPRRYSDTTCRHISDACRAFVDTIASVDNPHIKRSAPGEPETTYDRAYAQIFETPAVFTSDEYHRDDCAKEDVPIRIQNADVQISAGLRPRLHDTTRQSKFESARYMLRSLRRMMVQDIACPPQLELQHLDGHLHFLDLLCDHSRPMDERRVLAKSYLALEYPHGEMTPSNRP